jgi:hypothetical protein
MSDQEQAPSRSDAVRAPPHQLFHGAAHVDVQANNEIVLPRLCRPGPQIALDPIDALFDLGVSLAASAVRCAFGGRRASLSDCSRSVFDHNCSQNS